MKAIEMTEFGEPSVLTLVDKEISLIGDEDVRVTVYYAGVNPADTYIRQGGYAFFEPDFPYTPGFDAAGVIKEVGSHVTDYSVGDRVFVSATLSKHATGAYAEEMICRSEDIRKLPKTSSFKEGASLGIPAMAAYRALFQRGELKPQEKVLIHGASGGVGTLAVQMAKSFGAFVIGTAGNQEGLEQVKANGADLVLNHNEPHYLDNLADVDLVVEMLANVNLEKDLSILNKRGRVIVVGNRGSLDFNPRLTMAKEADIRGIAVWNATESERKESLDAIEDFLQKEILKPEIGSLYPLEKAAQAQDDIINQPSKGKMLLEIKQED